MQCLQEEMLEAVCRGDENKFKSLYLSLQWIGNRSIQYYYSLVTLACKHNSTEILKFLASQNAILSTRSDEEAIVGWTFTDEGHNAVYYAIRSGNLELLNTLLSLWPNLHPEQLDLLLSGSYEELKIVNVLISKEMELCVQHKLIDLRFFSRGNGEPITSKKNEIEELTKKIHQTKLRLQVLFEYIAILTTEYSNKKVDERFIHIAKFIAENIHIIKQQVKSSYKQVPWEEMEFCLLCFIVAQSRRQEINICYLSVLRKPRLLKHLGDFSKTMQTLDVSKLNESVRSSRQLVIEGIIKTYPPLEDLYDDYKHLRDLTSLDIMKRSIGAALLADSATREGQLSIKRALQVVGENLKNSLDSPNLSTAASELLLLSAPKETKIVLQTLRDSLSHLHSPLHDEATTDNLKLYSNMQNDIKKIGNVITDIMYTNKVNILKRYTLPEVVKCENIEVLQETLQIFQNIKTKDMNKLMHLDEVITREDQQIEHLIEKIDSQIVDQTPAEVELLFNIRKALYTSSLENRNKQEEYFNIITELNAISLNTFSTTCEMKRYILYFIDQYEIQSKSPLDKTATDNISLENKLDHFLALLIQFAESVKSRIRPEVAENIINIVNKISVITWCDKGYIKWIDDFRGKLSPEENQPRKGRKKSKRTTNTKDDRAKLDKQLEQNLSELGEIIESGRKEATFCNQMVLPGKKNKRSSIETLMLDIMSLVDNDCLPSNVLYLQDHTPLLTGRCLRNYLAHGNALVESILLTDSLSAVILNAMKLTQPETKKDLVVNKTKMGQVMSTDIEQFVHKFKKGLHTIKKYEEMCKALIEGNLENLKICLAEGADVNARNNVDWSTTLHVAAQGTNLEVIRYLIEKNVITDVSDANGQTPLHVAAAFGRDMITKFLVEDLGLRVDHADNQGKTPLHLAVTKGHKQTVFALLSLGAKPTNKDYAYQTPLHNAVQNNHIELVKLLLENDATVDDNKSDADCTALHIAAKYGHMELVQYLLENRADVNAKSFLGERPLHLAALNGHLDVAIILLDKGAHVNLRNLNGFTPLHNAVKENHEKVAEVLLNRGAFVEIGDKVNYRTPLHSTVLNGNKAVVSLLLQHKANINAISIEDDERTPLLYAAEVDDGRLTDLLLQSGADLESTDIDGLSALHLSAMHGYNDVVKSLINKGSNIEAKNRLQMTPLHLAARSGHRETVQILLSAGANVDSLADKGFTPLFLSTWEGHASVTETLILNKADVNAKNSINATPLHEAVKRSSNEKTVKLLLGCAHIDVNSKDTTNATALHNAASNGNVNIVDALIQHKADVNVQDEDGKTPLYMAVWGNHKAAVNLLLDNGADVNSLTKDGYSAICCAVRLNNKDILDILIKRGANVNEKGGEPLLIAILTGYRLAVQSLLQSENINVHVDYDGRSALRAAAETGNWNIGKALIDKGVVVDSIVNKATPLLVAISKGHKEFVDVLLENKADANLTPTGSVSPLHLAVAESQHDIAESLLRWGARRDVRDQDDYTPLESAVVKGNMKIVEILLQNQAIDINNVSNGSNVSLLYLAALGGNVQVVKYLVSRGADVNTTNDGELGVKAVHIATLKGHLEIVEFFLEAGMHIGDVDTVGATLLHYAAFMGQTVVAQYLIEKHADINAADFSGARPIHIAARTGQREFVKFLLSSGAVYDAVDQYGAKPLDSIENVEIEEILVSIEDLFKAVTENDASRVEILSAENFNLLNAKNANNLSLLHLASLNGFENICDILLKNKSNPNSIGKDGHTPLHYASAYSHFEITKALLTNGSIYHLKAADGRTPLDCATRDNIVYLLRLIDDTFQKVQHCNIQVIDDLTQINDNRIVKAVLKARNADGNTLAEVATRCGFPELKKLKQILQGNLYLTFSMVKVMIEKQNYAQALSTLTQLLNERIEILGEEDLGTLEIKYNISIVLTEQHKFSEALQILEEIYKKQKKSLGPNNRISLNTRSGIATTLDYLGKHQEAWDIFQEVIKKQRDSVDEDHANLFKTITNAVSTLHAMGKYDKALKLYRELHKYTIIMFHEHHPNTLSVSNNIAMVLDQQGEHNEALAIFQKNCAAAEVHLGAKHAVTLGARLGIASSLQGLNRADEALTTYLEVLAMQVDLPGSYSLRFLKLQYYSASLLMLQDKCDEALIAYKQAIDQGNANFGLNHREIEVLVPFINEFERILFQRFDINVETLLNKLELDIINAVGTDDISALEGLIRNGSDVDTADNDGRTPLHFATGREREDIVKLLLKSGADATATTKTGDTPLHSAASRACADIVCSLLQNVKKIKTNAYDSFINARNEEGASALHIAAKNGSIDIVKCLLENGAVYNLLDKTNKHTPLQDSHSSSVISILELAKETFACAERGDVARLREKERKSLAAVLNSRDTRLRTPAQVARLYHHQGVVEFLDDISQTSSMDVTTP